MKIIPYNKKTHTPLVMCLGAFDSVHLGHKSLIERAHELKNNYSAKVAVFTFNSENSNFKFKPNGEVFTFEERIKRLEKMLVDEVYVANVSEEFANILPVDFLNELVDNRPIRAFICGKDFKFGKNASGNVELLKHFCEQKNIHLEVCDFITDKSENKIATTTIKDNLLNGNVKEANKLLGDKYFVTGEVIKGRQVGRTLGFPTANIKLSSTKLPLKSGVYLSEVILGDKTYGAITNVGNAPTFNDENFLIECHIKDFSGDLYGKKLTVYFTDYIRPITKFISKDELIKQLNSDLKVIKWFYLDLVVILKTFLTQG